MAKYVAGVLAGMAVTSQGARISRNSDSAKAGKTLAGVPVLHYESAYGGRSATPNQKEHWLVFAKKGADSLKMESLCASSGACESVGRPSEGGVPFFEVFTTESELEKVLSQAPEDFEFVEPDAAFALEPEEEEVNAASSPWGLLRVGVPQASRKGAGVNIYVLDTGVRITHQDFGGRAFSGTDCTRLLRCVDCNPTDASCAGDNQGHGTHCAGSAAGTTFGVAPAATVYGVKVLTDSGSGMLSYIIRSVDWVATKPAPRIASMSLGGPGANSGIGNAVDAAVQSGVIVVVAGGNSNTDSCNFSPAFVSSAITVGSTTSQDVRSSFSNYGRCTNIWAPGSAVKSASHEDDTGAKTFSGTSMACPHVAGGAALLLEVSPGMDASGVVSQLQRNAEKDVLSDLKSDDRNLLLNVRR